MTEQDLLDALAPIIASTYTTDIRVGIGDDAAVWQPSRSHRSVISTDVSIEGVHFRREFACAEDIGYRALAVNLSDIAAMGAAPVLATIALTLPPDIDMGWLIDAYIGMAELARQSKIAIVGGDISSGSALSFAITVVGEVAAQRVKLRSTAHVHDVLAVTGMLGASRAGLALLSNADIARVADAAYADTAIAAYRRPVPRLAYAKFLAASKHVHAMMDLSDGIAVDVPRLARASRCGVRLSALPVAESAARVAALTGDDAHAWALGGGDDYELLIAVERRAFPHLAKRFAAYFGSTLYQVGTCIEGGDVSMTIDNVDVALADHGWDHLERRPQ